MIPSGTEIQLYLPRYDTRSRKIYGTSLPTPNLFVSFRFLGHESRDKHLHDSEKVTIEGTGDTAP